MQNTTHGGYSPDQKALRQAFEEGHKAGLEAAIQASRRPWIDYDPIVEDNKRREAARLVKGLSGVHWTGD